MYGTIIVQKLYMALVRLSLPKVLEDIVGRSHPVQQTCQQLTADLGHGKLILLVLHQGTIVHAHALLPFL